MLLETTLTQSISCFQADRESFFKRRDLNSPKKPDLRAQVLDLPNRGSNNSRNSSPANSPYRRSPILKTVSPSKEGGQDLNTTKEIDVDEELEAIHAAAVEKVEIARARSRSPIKTRTSLSSPVRTKDLAKDPDFVRSLKAQGFEESSSKSKLTYEFDSPAVGRKAFLSSPTRNASEASKSPERAPSPHKLHPMQFISPQVNKAIPNSPQGKTRSISPSKATNPALQPRPASPSKPHPLQFVSASPQHQQPAISRPPKPNRTWASVDQQQGEKEPLFPGAKTPSNKPIPAQKPHTVAALANEEKTDTASRRSMLEKRTLFENETRSADNSPAVDPAMMSLSERRALFEKNRTAPKPVARFGEAVTPAMLSK